MSKREIIRKFIEEVSSAWSLDKPTRLAAALAYYGMFSFVPVVYIAITVAGIFIDEKFLTEQVISQLAMTLGPSTAQFIEDLVVAASETNSSGSLLASLVSFVALLYAASGLFAHLQYSLNAIWHVPMEEQLGIVHFIKNRLLAFVLVIGVGLVLIVASLSSVVISILSNYIPLATNAPIANLLFFLGLATISFAIIYKVLPDVEIAWRDVWIGALVTAVLIAFGGWAVGLYLSISNIGSAFEAAGALAILLIGIYYIAQIFLFGAIFTRVYASMFGSQNLGDEKN